ncbi:MAG: hypothetical protein ACOCWC_04920 [Bacteroidota bacterium]
MKKLLVLLTLTFLIGCEKPDDIQPEEPKELEKYEHRISKN